jgi:hypothetical protein
MTLQYWSFTRANSVLWAKTSGPLRDESTSSSPLSFSSVFFSPFSFPPLVFPSLRRCCTSKSQDRSLALATPSPGTRPSGFAARAGIANISRLVQPPLSWDATLLFHQKWSRVGWQDPWAWGWGGEGDFSFMQFLFLDNFFPSATTSAPIQVNGFP